MKAKIFQTGRSQAVRLPKESCFEDSSVCIRSGAEKKDIVLSRRAASWDKFFTKHTLSTVPADFMNAADRPQDLHDRDPFAGSAS